MAQAKRIEEAQDAETSGGFGETGRLHVYPGDLVAETLDYGAIRGIDKYEPCHSIGITPREQLGSEAPDRRRDNDEWRMETGMGGQAFQVLGKHPSRDHAGAGIAPSSTHAVIG